MSLRWMNVGLSAVVATLALAGCVVQNDPSPSYTSSNGGTPPPSSTGGGGGGGGGGNATFPSANPMLADVDPNKTVTATPGAGVGVFVEYQTGGHWHVWWTCDTTTTGQSCAFDVKVSAVAGALTNVASQQFGPNDQLLTPTAQVLEALTTTTTGVGGVTFDAMPGSKIELQATVGGAYVLQGSSGGTQTSFLFFVQNGQVNGGFTGLLTNPLLLEGSTP